MGLLALPAQHCLLNDMALLTCVRLVLRSAYSSIAMTLEDTGLNRGEDQVVPASPTSPHATTIPSLILKLGNRNEEVRAQAAGVLYDLSASLPEQEVMIEAGAVPALRALLSEGGTSGERAACVLHRLSVHTGARPRIAEGGGVEEWVRLLQDAIGTLQSSAAGVLRNLAFDCSERQARIAAAGAIPFLVLLLSADEQPELQEDAAGAILNLSFLEANRPLLAEGGVIPELLSLLELGAQGNLTDIASGALETLALYDGAKKDLADCGAVAPLTRLLATEGLSRCHAAGALQSLAVHEEHQVYFKQAGTVRALADMLPSVQGLVLEKVMGTLSNLAHHKGGRASLLLAGAVPALLAVSSASGAGDANRVLQQLMLADLEAQVASIEVETLATLTDALQRVDVVDVSQKAAALLLQFSSHESTVQAAIRDHGGIQLFKDVLLSEQVSSRGVALTLVKRLAKDHEVNQTDVAADGGVERLVALLSSADVMEQGGAAAVLRNLAKDRRDLQELILAAGGLVPLAALLSADEATTRDKAAGAVRLLVKDRPQCQVELVERRGLSCLERLLTAEQIVDEARVMGPLLDQKLAKRQRVPQAAARGIKPIIAVLSLCSPGGQVVVAAALHELARGNAKQRMDLASAGGIATLAAMLNGSSSQVKSEAAGAVAALAATPTLHDDLLASGVLPGLVGLLCSASREFRITAAAVLRSLASAAGSRKAIVAAGAIQPLVKMLLADDDDEKVKASDALQNLAFDNAEHKSAIGRAGTVPLLLAMVRSTSRKGYASAAKSLQILATGVAANTNAVVQGGGIEALIKLLKTSVAFTDQESALSALVVLSSKATHSRVIESDGVPTLVKLLGAGSDCSALSQLLAAGILRDLASDSHKAAGLIRQAGALEVFMVVLGVESQLTQEAAVQAILGLARHVDHQASIIEVGAFLPLVDVISTGTVTGMEAAAEVLRRLVAHSANHELIVQSAGIPALMRLVATSGNVEREVSLMVLEGITFDQQKYRELVVEQPSGIPSIMSNLAVPGKQGSAAVGLLRNLCKGGASFQNMVSGAGALEALVVCLQQASPSMKAKLCDFTLRLTKDHKPHRLAFVSGGGVPPLAGISSCDDVKARTAAMRALTELTKENDNKTLIAKDLCGQLVLVLTHGTDDEQRLAVGLLHHLSTEPQNLLYISESGVVPALAKCLGDCPDDSVAERLAGLLQKLALEPTTTRLVVESNCVAPLVSLLAVKGQRSAAITLHKLAAVQATHMQFINAGAIQEMHKFIADENSKLRPYAAGILQHLASNSVARPMLAAEGSVAQLLPLLRCEELPLQEPAAGVLQFLAADVTSAAAVVEAGAVEPVVRALSAGSPLTQRLCASTCLSLARGSFEWKQLLVEAGAARPLLALLADDALVESGSVIVVAAAAVQSLAAAPELGSLLREAGAIRPFVALLDSSAKDLSDIAAGALQNLAVDEANQQAVVREGGIPPTVARLARNGPVGAESSLVLLLALAANSRYRPAIVDAGAVSVLLPFLSADDTTAMRAATVLRELATEPAGARTVAETGAVAPLVALLGAGDIVRDRIVTAALWHVASVSGYGVFVVDAGGVPHLIAMLSSEDETLQEVVAGTLLNLARDDESVKALLVTAGAIPPLVHLLSSAAELVRCASVSALYSFSAVPESRGAIVDAGGVKPLVELLSDRVVAVQEEAAWILHNMAFDDDLHKAAIFAAGGIEPTVALLISESTAAKRSAAGILQNLATSTRLRSAIGTAGGIAPLVGLLASRDETLQDAAVSALQALAVENSKNKLAVHAGGGLPGLVKLLSSSRHLAQEKSSLALQCLAEATQLQDAIREAGAIVPLVRLLTAGTQLVQESAAGALRNLASTSKLNRLAVVEAGGIALFVSLLSADDKESREHACASLQSLASDSEQNKVAIAQLGGIQALVVLLSEGSADVQANAAGALQSLTTVPENQVMFVEAGGLPVFVSLLRRGATVAQERAAGVLQNLTSHVEKRWDVVKAGGLAALIDVMEEGSPRARAHAAGALRNLAFDDDDGIVAIVEAGGLELLVKLLDAATEEEQENAAAALVNMSIMDYCKLAVARAGGIERLAALEARAPREATRRYAAAALRSLAREELNWPRVQHARDVLAAALQLEREVAAAEAAEETGEIPDGAAARTANSEELAKVVCDKVSEAAAITSVDEARLDATSLVEVQRDSPEQLVLG